MKKQYKKIMLITEKEKFSGSVALGSIYDILITISIAIAAVMLVLVFLFRVVTVSGASMSPTLNDGDRLILTANTGDLESGDIVVVSRQDDDPIVKRVIATGGDTLHISFSTGEVFVNGQLICEPYIASPTYLSYPDGPEFPLIVPEGYIFVMGDNRNDSLDSRSGEIGMIDENLVIGRVIANLDG